MGTEVLRPQNLWVERYHHVHQATSFHRRRNFPASGNLTNLIVNKKPYNNNSGQNKKTSPKPDRKKSPEPKNSKSTATAAAAAAAANGGSPVRQVTLLKRGESLDSLSSKFKGGNPNPNPNPNRKSVKSPNRKPVDDLAIAGTGRIGPDSPNMVLKQIRLNGPPPPSDMYAGSAFSLSPSPRSLPLPSFFNKKQQEEDLATKDLRRLLRLE